MHTSSINPGCAPARYHLRRHNEFVRSLTLPNPVCTAAGHAGPPHVGLLIVGTCILAVIVIVFILLCPLRWRGGSDKGKRFWVIWVIVLAASACSILWAADFLGGDSLSWTVPTLGAIEVGLFALWYPQRNGSAREPTLPPIDAGRTGPKAAGEDILVPEPASSNAEVATVSRDINDLTLTSLRGVISIVAERLHSQGQVESAVTFCGLNARFPTANADAGQLWEAVFAAALEEEKLISLVAYVRDHLGLRPKRQLEGALRDIGVTI
jgi:hypothetical protein